MPSFQVAYVRLLVWRTSSSPLGNFGEGESFDPLCTLHSLRPINLSVRPIFVVRSLCGVSRTLRVHFLLAICFCLFCMFTRVFKPILFLLVNLS